MIVRRRLQRIETRARRHRSPSVSLLTDDERMERTVALFRAANERIDAGFTSASCDVIRRAERVSELFDRARERKREAERRGARL